MKSFYLLVGKVVKPHGVLGELGVKNQTERPDLRFAPGTVLLAGPNESSLREVVIESSRPYRQGFLVCLEGVEDRDAAEAMRGWGLYIQANEAAEPEDGAFYPHQLLGLRVLEMDGREVGRVENVLELPAHDLLEVRGGGGRSVMVPLVEAIVREVDLEAGCVRVSLPEGLEDL